MELGLLIQRIIIAHSVELSDLARIVESKISTVFHTDQTSHMLIVINVDLSLNHQCHALTRLLRSKDPVRLGLRGKTMIVGNEKLTLPIE